MLRYWCNLFEVVSWLFVASGMETCSATALWHDDILWSDTPRYFSSGEKLGWQVNPKWARILIVLATFLIAPVISAATYWARIIPPVDLDLIFPNSQHLGWWQADTLYVEPGVLHCLLDLHSPGRRVSRTTPKTVVMCCALFSRYDPPVCHFLPVACIRRGIRRGLKIWRPDSLSGVGWRWRGWQGLHRCCFPAVWLNQACQRDAQDPGNQYVNSVTILDGHDNTFNEDRGTPWWPWTVLDLLTKLQSLIASVYGLRWSRNMDYAYASRLVREPPIWPGFQCQF